MIKYLEPREFYCAVITSVHWALFTLPEGASLSPLSTAQAEMVPAPSAQGLFMGSEDIWNMRWGWKGRTAAWLGGQCPLPAPKSHGDVGDLTWGDFGTHSASKAGQIPGKHAQKWGRKERDSLHKWALFFLRAASFASQGCFCTGKNKVKTSSLSGKLCWELKTSLCKWRGYSSVPVEHVRGLCTLTEKKNTCRVEKASETKIWGFWLV